MELKKFNTRLTMNDLDKFKEEHVKEKEAEEKFIHDYIKAHIQDNVTSKDDFYNMLLTDAILSEDIALIKHILSLPHEGNILVNVNRTDFSPICAALYEKNKQILDLVEEYIRNMPETAEKVNLVGHNYTYIFSIACSPPDDMTTVEWFKRFLYPLYTEESLKDLADLIGVNDIEENFDSTI